MKYVLFAGSRVGLEALRVMSELHCDVAHVFIESEHEHEHEKYYARSMEQCASAGFAFSRDPKQKEISDLLALYTTDGPSIDYVMSFGYRRMIPDSVLAMARIAALGTHFSPLPRYRGFAPLNWLLINGELETAVNLFYLDKDVDNGDIIDREPVSIDYTDDINSLYEKCIRAFRKVMKRSIPHLEQGVFKSVKQDHSQASYTCARSPDDGRINWQCSAQSIYNLCRALTYPYPGAFSYVDGQKLFVWSCEEYPIPKYEGRIPGKVIQILKDQGVVVLCGEGAVLLKDVQIESGKRQTADRVVRSVRQSLGMQ
jgi:methionyl-tRNA formyltransferase